MGQLSAIEIAFGVTSIFSILSSVFCLFQFRRFQTSKVGSSSPKDIQAYGFSFFVIYHLAMMIGFYMDMLMFDGQTTFWDRNMIYCWPQFIIYISFASLIVIWFLWLVNLWVKVTSRNNFSCLSIVKSKASEIKFILKVMKRMLFVIVLLHVLIIAISYEDWGRTLILASLIMASLLVPLVISCLIVIGDLFIVLFKSFYGGLLQNNVRFAIVRIMGFLLFVVGVGTFAAFDAFYAMSLQPSRVLKNLSRDEGENGMTFVSKRITIARFLYSCSGFVASLPFLLKGFNNGKSDNITGKSGMQSTDKPQQISLWKSRSQGDIIQPQV